MIKSLLWVMIVCLFTLSTSQADEKKLNIVFIPKSSDQVYWTFMRKGVDDALKEQKNIELTWRGPSYNDDTDAQIQILRAYSHTGVDAIIIAPTDKSRLINPINEASAQGIKMIIVDSAVDTANYQTFVTTDNYSSGQIAAKHLSQLLHNKGNVVLFRIVAGSASTDDRAEGFLEYLHTHAPDIKIIADVNGGGSRGKALHSATELLQKTNHIDAIFAVNESATDGVLRALRNEKLSGKIKLIGFDASDYLLAALDSNEIDALILQSPRQMGYLSIKAALAALHHTQAYPKTVFTEVRLVTKANYHTPEIQKFIMGN